MKFSRIVVLFILSLSSSLALSYQMFAGFDEFCGLPVIVGPDPGSASARRDAYGNPIIHVDPKVMSNWTMSRRFVIAHECAHHLLGHTSQLGALKRYYGGTREQELEADCWAAQRLSKEGFNVDIGRTALKYASEGHFSAGGYPSGTERAMNISHCASIDDDDNWRKTSSCRYRRVAEEYQDYEVRVQAVQVPCSHCGYNAWGYYSCYHPYDIMNQQVQVPVTKTRVVRKKVCD
ncbi:hypothetical protein [Pleionea sp. CnH1-48]|uniref:hypothetical protein n=1 Tax=Pleionea sp. CnH1-48 TaxID=2954494 RepID=UPI00209832CF|nr:hypothetical protein [Pleionea sp. CnH1-48]MCO7225907.1 hypothetical protein [Pleionea sp. CnH1-48]